MKMFEKLVLFAAVFFTAFAASAEVIYIEDTDFIVDLPVGWDVMDVTDYRYTFNDFTGKAFMQIKVWPGDKYDSIESMYDSVSSDLGASGEGDIYDYYGREAVFAVIEFQSMEYEYSGYALFADGDDFDFTVLSFADADSAEFLNDYLLSALDSFAVSPGLMLNPGPVSRYYLESFGTPERSAVDTVFEGSPVRWQIDMNEVEASQLVIEREAKVLTDYKPETEEGKEAWQRFYRLIYRDSYSRLNYFAALMSEKLSDSGEAPDSGADRREAIPKRLLAWLQGFEYIRTWGTSDLISPLTAAAAGQGDCDTRALLYIILLNHYGIDSALMVSSVYSHAMAAVDTPGTGARINVGGRPFLVAETTENIGIGMIASDMADPAKWLIVPLMEKDPWN